MRRALLVALGCTVLSHATLFAQTIPSPYRYIEPTQSVSLYTGYVETDRGERDLAPHSAPIVGAVYSIRFAGPVAGELGVGFLPSNRTVYGRPGVADTVLTPFGEGSAPLLLAEAGLRFNLAGPRTWRGLAPFVGASGGLITDLAGRTTAEREAEIPIDQAVDFGPAFAVGVSAGTDWFLTERLSLRATGRGSFWRFSTPEGFTRGQREETEWLQSFGGTLGVALHF